MPSRVLIARCALTLTLLAHVSSFAKASRPDSAPPPVVQPKRIVAHSIASMHVAVDGDLVDSVWGAAQFFSDFAQREPIQGAAPSTATEVAVLFDDDALYVAARMTSSDPNAVRREVTRHDELGTVERLTISLDTYHDRKTAYSFVVTAAGGTAEYFHADDQESLHDYSFNPVWDARTSMTSFGWSAEIRIPFSQLRFNADGEQVWGINLSRWIPDLNEDDYWIVIPKDESAWSSRFGELVGIRSVRRPVRAELLPYVAGQAQVDDLSGPASPFENGLGVRAGLDMRLGLGSGLSLDGTINPDFGQVDADPAQINLTDFELVQEERRPFFVEGADLLTGGGASYYYSRRIGARPHLAMSGGNATSNTTILGALKMTGRLRGGTSISALAALTGRELGPFFDPSAGALDTIEIEPLTTYAAVRAQQELGTSHSHVGSTLTAVVRDFDGESPLEAMLARTAFTGGADMSLRSSDGAWRLDANIGGTMLHGSNQAMVRLQRSSARYYQRPDAGYVSVDSTRTSLLGYVSGITLSRISGRWQGYLKGRIESPGLEFNDLGRIGSADEYAIDGKLSWLDVTPTAIYHNLRLDAGTVSEWNHGGVRTSTIASVVATMTLPSYWVATCSTSMELPSTSATLTRGGPNTATPLELGAGVTLTNDPSTRFGWHATLLAERDEIGGEDYSLEVGARAMLGQQWRGEVLARGESHHDRRQFITALDHGTAATYGRHYLFADLKQSTAVVQLRLGFAATPTLSVDLYAEPYLSTGRFSELGELPSAGALSIRRYEASGSSVRRLDDRTVEVDDGGEILHVPLANFTYASFRMNLVLRWDWLPGSSLYVVLQRSAEDYDGVARAIAPTSVFESIGAPGSQVFALKVSYWLPVN